ncbi:MAG TPA: hypothetical protein VFU76_06550 [Terriglobales bacterium]|nr:hypothetical protein [Terriglobales bacterium]
MDFLDRVLDSSRRFPKLVDPRTHAALDYLTISAFFVMAGAFWGRNKRAAATALVNGGMVLGVSLLTDYDGDGKRPISLRTHGKLDLGQMLTAAGMPSLLGFGSESAALPFRLQAMNEALVVGITDWDRRGTAENRVAA